MVQMYRKNFWRHLNLIVTTMNQYQQAHASHEDHAHKPHLHGWRMCISYKSALVVAGIIVILFVFVGMELTDQMQETPTIYEGILDIMRPEPLDDRGPVLRPNATQRLIKMVQSVRVLCLILTMSKDLTTKVAAINSTWVKRCDKHFYVLSTHITRPDFINVKMPDTRMNLVHKIQYAYEYIYDHYRNDFDFILKCDDDTYVIVENLKFLVSHYRPNRPGYIGFHFNHFIANGYMSGGAGYVMSNQGLRDLVAKGYRTDSCNIKRNPEDPENSEDLETGRCLQKVGVPVLSSLDREGRETFHPYPLHQHLFGGLPAYIYSWAKNPIEKGERCCSRYAISYHYMTTDSIIYMDYLLYKTSVFGRDDDNNLSLPVFKIGKV